MLCHSVMQSYMIYKSIELYRVTRVHRTFRLKNDSWCVVIWMYKVMHVSYLLRRPWRLVVSHKASLTHASLTHASLMPHKKCPWHSVPDASILDAPDVLDVLLQLSLTDSALNVPDAMCNPHTHLSYFPKIPTPLWHLGVSQTLPSQTPRLRVFTSSTISQNSSLGDLQRAVVAAELRDFGNKGKDITMIDQSNELLWRVVKPWWQWKAENSHHEILVVILIVDKTISFSVSRFSLPPAQVVIV